MLKDPNFSNESIIHINPKLFLKYGRGPKLEGCAFVNFGNSSGAIASPRPHLHHPPHPTPLPRTTHPAPPPPTLHLHHPPRTPTPHLHHPPRTPTPHLHLPPRTPTPHLRHTHTSPTYTSPLPNPPLLHCIRENNFPVVGPLSYQTFNLNYGSLTFVSVMCLHETLRPLRCNTPTAGEAMRGSFDGGCIAALLSLTLNS